MNRYFLNDQYMILQSYIVFHPSMNQARPCLASEIRRDQVRSGWYDRRLDFMFSDEKFSTTLKFIPLYIVFLFLAGCFDDFLLGFKHFTVMYLDVCLFVMILLGML